MPQTKKGERGRQVVDLADLVFLASRKRAVVVEGPPSFGKPKPAAFIACMQGNDIHRMLQRGMYVWDAPPKAGGGPVWHQNKPMPLEGEDNERT